MPIAPGEGAIQPGNPPSAPGAGALPRGGDGPGPGAPPSPFVGSGAIAVKDLPAADKARVLRAIASAERWQTTDEYLQIIKNYDYFEGGEFIEKQLRGGYSRFDLSSVRSSKDSKRSPKTSQEQWRAPAQKTDEPWSDFQTRRLEFVNFTKVMALERGSLLYRHQPVRTFEGPGAEQVETVINHPLNNKKTLFKSMNVNTILGGTIAIIPWWKPSLKTIILKAYDRRFFNCVYSVDGDMDTFTHFGTVEDPAQNNKTVTYYQVWTQEKVFTVTDDMKVTRQEQHFCGDRIPVCLWKEPTYDLSQHYGSVTATDFVLNNEAVNIKLSDILRIADYQSFSILFTINVDAPGYIGPGAHLDAKNIKEGEPCHAEFLSPNAPLDKLQNILEMQMEQMHKAGRIPAGVVFPDNSATSGIHLVIQWFPIQKLFEELKPVYEENENKLAKTISLVQARWANREPTRPIPDVDLYPNFDDESVMPRDDEAKRARDEWELQQGIITPIDIMMQKDPDLDREDAKRKFKDNVKENQEIGYVPGGPTGNFQKRESLEGVLGQFDKDDEGFTGEA